MNGFVFVSEGCQCGQHILSEFKCARAVIIFSDKIKRIFDLINFQRKKKLNWNQIQYY